MDSNNYLTYTDMQSSNNTHIKYGNSDIDLDKVLKEAVSEMVISYT